MCKKIIYLEIFIALLALGVVIDVRGFWAIVFSGHAKVGEVIYWIGMFILLWKFLNWLLDKLTDLLTQKTD